MKESPPENVYVGGRTTNGAADALYATVRELLLDLLVDPMKDVEVAKKLQISAWAGEDLVAAASQ